MAQFMGCLQQGGKVEDQAKDLEFDIPYRELGFNGVPPVTPRAAAYAIARTGSRRGAVGLVGVAWA